MNLLIETYKPVLKEDFLGLIPFNQIYDVCSQNKKFIICIHGFTGSGKSCLVSHILSKFNLHPIIFDNSFVKSNSNYKEKLNILKFKGILNSCIVFEDYEQIISDNFYHTTIETCLVNLKLPIIFTVNENYLKKFHKSFKVLDVCYFSIMKPTKKSTKIFIDKIVSAQNIKISHKDKLNSINFLPDIRKVVQSLDDNVAQKIDASYVSNGHLLADLFHKKNYLENIHNLSSDFFFLVPMLHESYPSLVFPNKVKSIAYGICISDIINTSLYKNQNWDLSPFIIYPSIINAICNSPSISLQSSDFPFGSILCKMSNKQNKVSTFNKLNFNLKTSTPFQIYAYKLINKKKIQRNVNLLLKNQFIFLNDFSSTNL